MLTLTGWMVFERNVIIDWELLHRKMKISGIEGFHEVTIIS